MVSLKDKQATFTTTEMLSVLHKHLDVKKTQPVGFVTVSGGSSEIWCKQTLMGFLQGVAVQRGLLQFNALCVTSIRFICGE